MTERSLTPQARPSPYTYTQAGVDHPRLRVTDDHGASDTTSLTLTALTPHPTITTPLSISGFRADPAVFLAANSRRAPAGRGTSLRYRPSENARVTLTIQRTLPGRHRRTCVPPSQQLTHAARCTRYHTIATLTRTGRRGPNTIAFTGRIAGRALPAGTYQLVIRATDPTAATPHHTAPASGSPHPERPLSEGVVAPRPNVRQLAAARRSRWADRRSAVLSVEEPAPPPGRTSREPATRWAHRELA